MKSMGNLIILIESYRRFCRPFVYATGCHVSSQGLLNGRHVAVSGLRQKDPLPLYFSPCTESDSCPRALLTCTHLRRTFHYWSLCPFFRRVVFRAHRVVDWAPNHTSERWAEWATTIWGAISAYWRASHARRSGLRLKKTNVGSSGTSSTSARKSISKH